MGLADILDIANNILQILVVAAAAIWAIWHAMRGHGGRVGFQLLAGALGCFLLGDIFLLLHLLLAAANPIVFSAADLSYLGFYAFLIAVCLEEAHGWGDSARAAPLPLRRVALLGPVVVVMFHIAYIVIYPDILINNLIYCLVMCILLYHVVWHTLAAQKQRSPMFTYHRVVLAYLLLELVMFLVSSFGWYLPGIAVDFVLTFFYPLMVRAMIKGATV